MLTIVSISYFGMALDPPGPSSFVPLILSDNPAVHQIIASIVSEILSRVIQSPAPE